MDNQEERQLSEQGQAKLRSAVEGFSAAHTDISQKDLDEFEAHIRASLLASPRLTLEERRKIQEDRKARRAVLTEAIEKNKLIVHVGRAHKLRIDERTGELSMLSASSTGGFVIAEKLGGSEVEFAVSICRDNESFDILLGKELAVSRLLKGETLTYDLYGDDTEEKFPSLKNLADNYKKYLQKENTLPQRKEHLQEEQSKEVSNLNQGVDSKAAISSLLTSIIPL